VSPPQARPVVYKFGGSSVAEAEPIRHVAELVADGPEALVVVVSALRGVTDLLIELASGRATTGKTRFGELRTRHLDAADGLGLGQAALEALRSGLLTRLGRLQRDIADAAGDRGERADAVLATGEDLAVLLLTAAVRAAGREVALVDARKLVRTDARFGAGVPDGAALPALAEEHLLPLLDLGVVAVVQGFVGSTANGRTTTLGRGGGDYTAALLGGAISAEVVHIWTDVIGLMSGDPRDVDAPTLLAEIGFEEAVELAWGGAGVIHPVAAKWAVARGVPLRIRSTFQPDNPGTLLRHDLRGTKEIAAVTAKHGVALMKVRSHPSALPYGFLARVFEIMARHRLDVDLVATSHSSTAFTIDESAELEVVAAELAAFAEVEVRRDLSTVTVVGRGMLAEPGMDAVVFWTVERTPVHLISQASDVSLAFVVDAAAAPGLVRKLHHVLIEVRADVARRSA
jgi:aspartate kinase